MKGKNKTVTNTLHQLQPSFILDLELPGAERVCDVLYGVTEAVGIVVGGVDAPLVSCPGVWPVFDPVCHWILLTIFQFHLHT